jgi:hypothetical protein
MANEDQDAFKASENIIIREPQNCIAARSQPTITYLIAPKPRSKIMRLPVQLHNQLGGVADKIDDVGAHRRLPSKLTHVQMAGFQVAP